MRLLVLALLSVTTCTCEPTPAVTTMSIGPSVYAWYPSPYADSFLEIYCHRNDSENLQEVSTRETIVVDNEFVVGTRGDFVRTTFRGHRGWLSGTFITAAEHDYLSSLAAIDADSEGCTFAHVLPFADPSRAIVRTPHRILLADVPTSRSRELDQIGGTLEGCSMNAARDAYECSLDLNWNDARIDREGNDLNGNFQRPSPWE